MKDPIVEEVREARKQHAERLNYDLRAICEDLRRRELALNRRIAFLPPKPAPKAVGVTVPK